MATLKKIRRWITTSKSHEYGGAALTALPTLDHFIKQGHADGRSFDWVLNQVSNATKDPSLQADIADILLARMGGKTRNTKMAKTRNLPNAGHRKKALERLIEAQTDIAGLRLDKAIVAAAKAQAHIDSIEGARGVADNQIHKEAGDIIRAYSGVPMRNPKKKGKKKMAKKTKKKTKKKGGRRPATPGGQRSLGIPMGLGAASYYRAAAAKKKAKKKKTKKKTTKRAAPKRKAPKKKAKKLTAAQKLARKRSAAVRKAKRTRMAVKASACRVGRVGRVAQGKKPGRCPPKPKLRKGKVGAPMAGRMHRSQGHKVSQKTSELIRNFYNLKNELD